MNKILIGTVVLASLVCGHAYAAVYNYTGNKYTSVYGAYTAAMQVTGTMTTSVPIPPNSVDFDITGILTSWSFFDGVLTISNLNGFPHPLPNLRVVSTDASGNISSTSIIVIVQPLGTAIGHFNDVIFVLTGGDTGGKNAKCMEVTGSICTGWTAFSNHGMNSSAGVWVTVPQPPPQPVPLMPQWSLLLTLLLGMAGLARLRQQA